MTSSTCSLHHQIFLLDYWSSSQAEKQVISIEYESYIRFLLFNAVQSYSPIRQLFIIYIFQEISNKPKHYTSNYNTSISINFRRLINKPEVQYFQLFHLHLLGPKDATKKISTNEINDDSLKDQTLEITRDKKPCPNRNRQGSANLIKTGLLKTNI